MKRVIITSIYTYISNIFYFSLSQKIYNIYFENLLYVTYTQKIHGLTPPLNGTLLFQPKPLNNYVSSNVSYNREQRNIQLVRE